MGQINTKIEGLIAAVRLVGVVAFFGERNIV